MKEKMDNQKLTLEQIAKFPRPGMAGVPTRIGFTPDSQTVTFLQAEGNSLVLQLWAWDIKTHTRRKLIEPPAQSQNEANLSQEEKLRRERTRLREVGVTSYQFAPKADQTVLLVPMAGKLYVRHGEGELSELADSEGAIDARLSPDGKRVAFVRDNQLWVMSSEGGKIYQISTQGRKDGSRTAGLAEFVAQEEMGRSEGFWWQPDSQGLAYQLVDNQQVPKFVISHTGDQEPSVEEHFYPFAGKANAQVSLYVTSLTEQALAESQAHLSSHGIESSDGLRLSDAADFYLARVAWRPDGVITAQIEARDQHSLQLKAFPNLLDEGEVLVEEHGNPWLNLNDDSRFLESGEILWASERTGFKQLYLLDKKGQPIRTLTTGDGLVINVVMVDQPRRLVYFRATRDGVRERQLYVVSLDRDEIQRVTSEAGWHEVTFSPDGNYFIDTFSNLEHAPTITLRRSDGEYVATLFENKDSTAQQLNLRPPELFSFQNRSGVDLHGAIYLPPAMQSDRRYPLIVSVYGGPQAQRVMDEWSLTIDLRAQYLSQQGYVVLKVDNRGSGNRGLAFEGALAGQMGYPEVDDQVDGVRFVAQRGFIDAGRVGIYGWSYGGYMTIMSLLRAPEVFKVGVAGAPVTDWFGYDTHYTERYMGLPASNSEGYQRSAALAHVENLAGKLLLVHGLIDENVHFRHTARLIEALTAAQKTYDLMVFPSERHMPRNSKGLEYLERRLIEYFATYLKIA